MQLAHLEAGQITETDRVALCRAEELERVGYSVFAAAALAVRRDVDLHTAVALIKKGCPHDTAVRILL